MADIENHLQNYGKEIGLPELKFNEQGICSLNFDSKINVDIVYRKEQDQCILAAPIGDLPSEGKENFFKELLVANAFGIDNAGAALGVEEEENRVVLSYVFIASIVSFDLFKTILANFVNLAEEWISKCETLQSSSKADVPGLDGNIPFSADFEFTKV